MMIHICKAFDVDTQEEISQDYFEEIPAALDEYFFNYPLKSTQDKAILAEMIGRVGPLPQLTGLLDKLLTDKDENVRQYSLHSLEYHGKENPLEIMPYIERFQLTNDTVMVMMAAHLCVDISCTDNYALILEKLREWHTEGKTSFVKYVLKLMVKARKDRLCKNNDLDLEKLQLWMKDSFGSEISLS